MHNSLASGALKEYICLVDLVFLLVLALNPTDLKGERFPHIKVFIDLVSADKNAGGSDDHLI